MIVSDITPGGPRPIRLPFAVAELLLLVSIVLPALADPVPIIYAIEENVGFGLVVFTNEGNLELRGTLTELNGIGSIPAP